MINSPIDRTLTDQVVQQLRKQIILGRLPPGERLTEVRLSAEFEVSRSTVREALRRLEAESLIEFSSHRGARVALLSPEDAMQISEIHSMLGVHAVRQLTLPVNEQLHEKLRLTVDEMSGLHFPSDVDRFIELDTSFHRNIFVATGQRRVLEVWSGVSGLLGIVVSLSLRMFNVDGNEVARRHDKIVEALSEPDTELAAQCMVEHYRSNESRLRLLMLAANAQEGTKTNGRDKQG